MKKIQENIYELIVLIGIVLISIGFFMLYIPIGFIASGIMLIFCILLLWMVQQRGGD